MVLNKWPACKNTENCPGDHKTWKKNPCAYLFKCVGFFVPFSETDSHWMEVEGANPIGIRHIMAFMGTWKEILPSNKQSS